MKKKPSEARKRICPMYCIHYTVLLLPGTRFTPDKHARFNAYSARFGEHFYGIKAENGNLRA